MNVGNAFADGKAVLKDDRQAAHFYRLGCDAGEPLGCFNLSVFRASGRGGPRDLVGAYTYADRACARGAPLGCVRVAQATILGEGVAKDTTGGVGQLDAMCTGGEVEGCKALCTLYDRGLGDVQAEEGKSADYLKKACDLHDDVSCSIWKLQKTEDLTATTPARINALLRNQCNAGNMKSCEKLGRNLIAGRGAEGRGRRGGVPCESVQWGGGDRVCAGGAVRPSAEHAALVARYVGP